MPPPGTSRPPLPKLSPLDEALFEEISADTNLNLAAIAAKHKISASLALERITAEPITAYLAVFERFVSIRESARQSLAISRLTKLMDSSPDPAEQRRAATTVLQASFKLLYPPRSSHASLRGFTDSSPEQAPPNPAATKDAKPARAPLVSPAPPPSRTSSTQPQAPAKAPALASQPFTPSSDFRSEPLDALSNVLSNALSPAQPSFHITHAAPPSFAMPGHQACDRPRPRLSSTSSLAIAAGAPP